MLFRMFKLISIFLFLVTLCTFCKPDTPPETRGDSITIKSDKITQHYLGNGVQWGGYDILEPWTGNPTLSDEDWNTLFQRVQFMRPPLVRIMVSSGWNYMVNNQYNPAKSEPVLIKILDFCQQQDISVILGEWGHTGGTAIDQTWLNNSASFLQWLLETKGYTCIKYFTMVNEPNGSWSSINGNYTLWKQLVEAFHSKLVDKGIASRIKMLGPDIAIWNSSQTHWISEARFDIGTILGAYDIHTYPTETDTRDGSYQTMIETYRKLGPASHPMIMGEFGFKYASGSELGNKNAQRIANDPYASDDSNMMIYDAFYGVDVADAIMQNMLGGYAGLILWNLDDAMYNIDGYTSTRLKRWGFWNILGAEKFGNATDENIRPWFYPTSLLCRYFPAGTEIFSIELPSKKGLRAIAGHKDGKYTIAIVNSNHVSYSVSLAFEEGIMLSPMKAYKYTAGAETEFTATTDQHGFAAPYQTDLSLDFTNGQSVSLSLQAQSFWLYTNMD